MLLYIIYLKWQLFAYLIITRIRFTTNKMCLVENSVRELIFVVCFMGWSSLSNNFNIPHLLRLHLLITTDNAWLLHTGWGTQFFTSTFLSLKKQDEKVRKKKEILYILTREVPFINVWYLYQGIDKIYK